MDEHPMHRSLANLGSTLSRRTLGGLAASLLLALGLNEADAKKKKKKKKKPAPKPNPKPTCTPKCSGKTCGSNGCGGSCGSCGQGSTCSAQGQCVATQPYELVTAWGEHGEGNGEFEYPSGVAVDSNGNVYVSDRENNRVQKFSNSGAYITQWGSKGTGDGQFQDPEGIAVDSSGNVFVVDQFNRRVQKFRQNSGNPLVYDLVTKWGTFGDGNGQLNFAWGIAVDRDGNVYVADEGLDRPDRVQKFSNSGAYITQWPTKSKTVAVDSSGNVYLANNESGTIEKYSGTGTLLQSIAGEGDFTTYSIATDSDDNLYAVNYEDWPDVPVQKFNDQGEYVLTLGRESRAHTSLAVDADGNVFIGDWEEGRIVKYRRTGASRAGAGRSGASRSHRGKQAQRGRATRSHARRTRKKP